MGSSEGACPPRFKDTGTSNRTSIGINGRQVVYEVNVLPEGLSNQEGKLITVRVCFNQSGTVNYAEFVDKQTDANLTSEQMKYVLNGFKKYKFEEDSSSPVEVCGKLRHRITETDRPKK